MIGVGAYWARCQSRASSKASYPPQPLAQRVGRILIGPFRLPELGELVIGGVDLAGEVGIVKKQGSF